MSRLADRRTRRAINTVLAVILAGLLGACAVLGWQRLQGDEGPEPYDGRGPTVIVPPAGQQRPDPSTTTRP